MKQSDAVFAAISNVFAQNNLSIEGSVKDQLTKTLKEQVCAIVVEGFKSGKVDLSDEARAKFDTDQKLKSYTNGMITNWVNKDKRLNGGVKYEAKNPGSRAGAGDAQLKALKALMSQVDDAAKPEIQAAIDARIAELKPDSTTEIDVDALPEAIRAKFCS